jgi:hypothetical protein
MNQRHGTRTIRWLRLRLTRLTVVSVTKTAYARSNDAAQGAQQVGFDSELTTDRGPRLELEDA